MENETKNYWKELYEKEKNQKRDLENNLRDAENKLKDAEIEKEGAESQLAGVEKELESLKSVSLVDSQKVGDLEKKIQEKEKEVEELGKNEEELAQWRSMFPKQSPEKAAEILKNFVGEMEKKRKEELEEIRTKLGKEKNRCKWVIQWNTWAWWTVNNRICWEVITWYT